MKVLVHDIPDEGFTWEAEISIKNLPMLQKIAKEDDIRFLSPIWVHIEIAPQYGLLNLKGEVTATVSAQCGRCLERYEIPIQGKLVISFAQELPEVEDTTGEEVELSADDMGVLLLKEPEIDLSQIVEEQIILELPYFPLCSTDCQGLCHTCGSNLNSQPCTCQTDTTDPRWDALRQLQRH